MLITINYEMRQARIDRIRYEWIWLDYTVEYSVKL